MSNKGSVSTRRVAMEKIFEKARSVVSLCNNVSKFEKIQRIGQGTFGVVYKARDKATDEIVALKKVIVENQTEGFPITTLREISTLQNLKHNNIVKLIEVCFDSKRALTENPITTFYLVFEFCQHDLAGLLQNENVCFTLGEKKMIMKQLLNALFHVHGKGFIHRDLKSSNILVTKNGTIKLADFGLARQHRKSSQNTYTRTVVTLWYRPPEVLLGDRNYGPPTDIWGAGCVMAELWTRQPILKGSSDIDQLKLISHLCGSITPEAWPKVEQLKLYKKFELPKGLQRRVRDRLKCAVNDSKALQLLDKMLVIDPEKRVDSDEALCDDFFYSDPMPCVLRLSQYDSMFDLFISNKNNSQALRINHLKKAADKDAGEYYERVF